MTARAVGGARARIVVLLLAGTVLTGCGDSSSAGQDADPGAASTTGTTTGTTTAVGGSGELTAPGTSLAVGETATVPLDDDAGTIELTVTAITEGDPQDVPHLDGTPYYVRLTATAVSGDAYQFFVDTYVGAWSGGDRVPPIATPLTVGPCERRYFAQHPAPGTTLDTCLTFVVDSGAAPIDEVGFENDGGYRLSDGTAVDWS